MLLALTALSYPFCCPLAAGAGSITAALFLKHFVKDKSPDAMWAHMDIAGPVWNDKKGGATGYAVRTLVGVVESFGK